MRNETAQKLSAYADILVRQKAQLGQTETVTKESVHERMGQLIIDFIKTKPSNDALSLARLHCEEAQRNYEAKQISKEQYRDMYNANIGNSFMGKIADLLSAVLCWFGAEQAKNKQVSGWIFTCGFTSPDADYYKEFLFGCIKSYPSMVSIIGLKITYNQTFLNQ